MDDKFKKNKGNAGLEGVQFQLDLLIVFLLNALQRLKNWKISSENEEAGKYDDLVLELPNEIIFLQAKFRQNKRINRDQLLSSNTKNADFSLAKYFFSYLGIKSKTKDKTFIICTNTEINTKGLENVLTHHYVNPNSPLHYEGSNSTFFTFNSNILPDLKESLEIYFHKNLQGKDVNRTGITDENMESFLKHLQLFHNYPSRDELHKIIEQLLSHFSSSSLWYQISYLEIYRKVENWYKYPKGEYLTEFRAKAMNCEIRSDRYTELLKNYGMSFQRNDFNFRNSSRIFHVHAEEGYLLQMLKIFDALQAYKNKKLFVNPDDDIEIQKHITEAFDLSPYGYLIIVWSKIKNDTSKTEINRKLKEILEKHEYKKVILVAESYDKLVQEIERKDIFQVYGFVKLEDLSRNSQKRLRKNRNIFFQGRKVSIEKLLVTSTNKDYTNLLHGVMLEKLVKKEEVKIGKRLLELDEEIARYYIPRTFEKENRVPWRKSDIIPEECIFDVTEKMILISDCPGMGKTTVLTKIAAQIKENYCLEWVIRINLSDYMKILKDCVIKNKQMISLKELLNSQEATTLTRFEEFVFSINEKVILLLDSVDEISPNYTDLIYSLLRHCQAATNIAKIFITTRNHMTEKLKGIFNVIPFKMLPFTRENQIEFLTNYWMYNLKLDDTNKSRKCQQYAQTLIHKMSSWTEPYAYAENTFGAVPLQVKMVAEIFQEKNVLQSRMDWEGCREYLNSDEAEPKLPEEFNITELYTMFIKKKRDIFIDKGNPSGNPAAEQALCDKFEECFSYHRSYALKLILTENQCNLFTSYFEGNSNCVLKIGIMQICDGNLIFIHRTFAEYFVAASISLQLQQNTSANFQKFLIEEILIKEEFKLIRTFLDRFLQKAVDSLPPDIFDKYQFETSKSNLLDLIFNLAEEGYVAFLQLILKSVHINIIVGKKMNTKCCKTKAKRRKQNTLNVTQIIVREAGVNFRDKYGQSLLHRAIRGGHLEMVKFLIEQITDDNIGSDENQTALHFAAKKDKFAIVKYFLDMNTDINIRDSDGCTPLHLAIRWGTQNMVDYLIEHGAPMNDVDCHGRTILHRAAAEGRSDIVTYLLKRSIDVNNRDNEGRTPLHIAAGYRNFNIVNYLVKYGSDIYIKDYHGDTALHKAAEWGDLTIIKYLVEQGLDVNDRGYKGRTPLHLTARCRRLDAVNYLIGHGSDINVKDIDGDTMLHKSIETGDIRTVRYMIQLGVDVNAKGCKGRTPLHLAVCCQWLNIVNYLIERGSDINIKDSDGNGILHIAVETGDISIVKYVAERSVDVNDRCHRGRIPLHLAVRFEELNVINYLVEHGSDINIKDDDGCTVLHYAVRRGELKIVKYLVEQGADINSKCYKGRTPLQLAVRWGKWRIVNYLVEHGAYIINIDRRGRRVVQTCCCI